MAFVVIVTVEVVENALNSGDGRSHNQFITFNKPVSNLWQSWTHSFKMLLSILSSLSKLSQFPIRQLHPQRFPVMNLQHLYITHKLTLLLQILSMIQPGTLTVGLHKVSLWL